MGELDLPVPAVLSADRHDHLTTVDGPKTFHIGLNIWLFTILMFVLGIAWAFGKASVFKYISDEYPTNIGVISGVVGLAGGMGGFVLPIMFGALMDLTGIRSSRLHADVRRGLGFADLDVLDGSARRRNSSGAQPSRSALRAAERNSTREHA